jgi:hypothetical protein
LSASDRSPHLPKDFALYQNYPNPWNPSTTIEYDLPKAAQVSLTVYDLLGREVAILVNETEEPGKYSVQCDGSHLTSGVYFYRLQARRPEGGQAGDFVQTRKLLIVK